MRRECSERRESERESERASFWRESLYVTDAPEQREQLGRESSESLYVYMSIRERVFVLFMSLYGERKRVSIMKT